MVYFISMSHNSFEGVSLNSLILSEVMSVLGLKETQKFQFLPTSLSIFSVATAANFSFCSLL